MFVKISCVYYYVINVTFPFVTCKINGILNDKIFNRFFLNSL